MLMDNETMLEEKHIKVSVCVVTYNQEKYIQKCLESLVNQDVDFDFEIIVSDDCSTDGTRNIINEFVLKYPSIIRPIFHNENIGAFRNFVFVHKQACGQYVAHMDGDDYALPGKLQKQANFLDCNLRCSFVCHYVNLVSEDGREVLGKNPAKKPSKFTDINRLVRDYLFFAHSSKMYRKSSNVFNHCENKPLIDFLVHVEHASMGDIGFLPEILGCSRKNCGGITAGTGEKLRKLIDLTLDGFERAYQLGVDKKLVDYGRSKYLVGASLLCLRRGDISGYQHYLNSSCENGYFSIKHRCLFVFRRFAFLVLVSYRIRQSAPVFIRRFF